MKEIPNIPQEVADHLKAERLQQYQVKIYQTQMDIAAFTSVHDAERLAQATKQLEDWITAYHAVEVM